MRLETGAANWRLINDTVMGGVSTAEIHSRPGHLLFCGHLSLEHGGGFASVRGRFDEDFSGTEAFRLVLRGDGRRYQFRLRSDDSNGGIAWRVEFDANRQTREFRFPLTDFTPVFRGQVISEAGPLNPADIRFLGFMLADRQEGPFSLEIHSIEALP